ncbi:hypothetical protein BU25DRAFT_110798 [Macroventuria anomochaeta]|uniref:Uncharacterized protein n=1 Tax=Macroventuria anomochaeta TaxID=301207 RepID=A0ACB6RX97_9PLEO|nr:uncharacterized protein BU25DRAFT_110798 [Macroventuria anomochaeta]KAF2625763.1 hypothetical protein BU25DRAFT_110798 [Macroventuria anomochaeta]
MHTQARPPQVLWLLKRLLIVHCSFRPCDLVCCQYLVNEQPRGHHIQFGDIPISRCNTWVAGRESFIFRVSFPSINRCRYNRCPTSRVSNVCFTAFTSLRVSTELSLDVSASRPSARMALLFSLRTTRTRNVSTVNIFTFSTRSVST